MGLSHLTNGVYSREQQGLSSGHWLLELQVVVAQAVADKARSEVIKRTMVEIMY